jgi:hypothetical protein
MCVVVLRTSGTDSRGKKNNMNENNYRTNNTNRITKEVRTILVRITTNTITITITI